MTVAQLCDHFEQRELTKENTWRSHATKKIYKAYLNRWVRPHWQRFSLPEVRTIQVESWLRTLPLAKSSCAKIRNLMSVLFNHACRYELFDRNPIYLVRQSAKRRRVPVVLLPAEIKILLRGLGLRERTLVLLAASTGLRQSEIFGLKWGDIDLRSTKHRANLVDPAPGSALRRTGPSGHQTIEAIKTLLRRGRGYKNLGYLLLKAQRMAATKTEFIVFQKAA
jgi:integrase